MSGGDTVVSDVGGRFVFYSAGGGRIYNGGTVKISVGQIAEYRAADGADGMAPFPVGDINKPYWVIGGYGGYAPYGGVGGEGPQFVGMCKMVIANATAGKQPGGGGGGGYYGQDCHNAAKGGNGMAVVYLMK